MDNQIRHTITTSLIVALVTLPVMGLVYATHRDLFLLFGILGMLMLAMLIFVRPILGLPAFLVIRPAMDILGDRRFSFGSVEINVAAIMSILAIVWALWVLIPHWKKVVDLPLFWPALLFFGISLWSMVYSISPTNTITELLRLGGCFLLLFVALWQTKKMSDLLRIFQGFAVGLLIPVMVAFIQVLTHNGLTFADSVNRAYGTFGHPNVLAFYLVLAILALLGLRTAFPRERATHPVIVTILILTLILTQTRGAWLGLLVGLGVVGIMKYRQLLVIGLVSLVAVLLLLPILQTSLSTVGIHLDQAPIVGPIVQRQFDTSSFDWRLDVWKEMKHRFADRPVFGFGLGTFPTLRQLQVFDIYDQGIGAHNDYLRLLIELGVVGISFYAVVLSGIFRNIVHTIRLYAPTHFAPLPLFILAFWIAFLVMSYFDNLLQSTPVMWASFILLGAVVATKPVKKKM